MATPNPYMLPEADPVEPLGRGVRPAGVSILGILAFVSAAAAALGALFMFLLGGAIGAIFGSDGAIFGAALGAFVGIFFLVGAAAAALMGYGHWTGAGWAWILQLVFSGISVVTSLFGVAQGDFGSVLGLIIPGVIVWYMLQPGVKRWYGRA